jgi:hypothetical protein
MELNRKTTVMAVGLALVSVICAALIVYSEGHVPAAVPDPKAEWSLEDWEHTLEYVSKDGLVDFEELEKDREPLDRFVTLLESVSPNSRPELFKTGDQKLAYWLNAHAALAMQASLDQWHTGKALGPIPMRFKTWKVGGKRVSLRAIQNHHLQASEDVRIPFATFCGARGCAKLMAKPFAAETLDAQLNEAVKRFIQDRHHVWIEHKTIALSPLLQEHEDEIKKALPSNRPGGVLQFVWAFMPDECLTTPGCDRREELDTACGKDMKDCTVKYNFFDEKLAQVPPPTLVEKDPKARD